MTLAVEESAADSKGAALVWQATYPPLSHRPPLHFHPQQTEQFTILSGGLRINHLGRTRDLAEGDTLTIQPREVHAMWNPFAETARVRWETSPALQTERWMGMLMTLAAARRTKPDGVPGFFRLAVLLHAYRDELRVCRPPGWLQMLVLWPAATIARLFGVSADKL